MICAPAVQKENPWSECIFTSGTN